MMALLQAMPLWALACLVVFGCTVLTALGMFLANRLFAHRLPEESRSLASGMLGTVGAIYSLLIAFVAVQVWQDLIDAAAAAEAEAASALEIVYDTQAFGSAETVAVREALRTYLSAVIEREWPVLDGTAPCPDGVLESMSSGSICPVARTEFIALMMSVASLEPADDRQGVWLGSIVAGVNEMAKYRLDRIASSTGSLPGLFWVILLVGGTLMMGYACLSAYSRTNVLMVSGLGASLGLVLFLILALDSPFTGEMGVKPDSFRMVLNRMNAPAALPVQQPR